MPFPCASVQRPKCSVCRYLVHYQVAQYSDTITDPQSVLGKVKKSPYIPDSRFASPIMCDLSQRTSATVRVQRGEQAGKAPSCSVNLTSHLSPLTPPFFLEHLGCSKSQTPGQQIELPHKAELLILLGKPIFLLSGQSFFLLWPRFGPLFYLCPRSSHERIRPIEDCPESTRVFPNRYFETIPANPLNLDKGFQRNSPRGLCVPRLALSRLSIAIRIELSKCVPR